MIVKWSGEQGRCLKIEKERGKVCLLIFNTLLVLIVNDWSCEKILCWTGIAKKHKKLIKVGWINYIFKNW